MVLLGDIRGQPRAVAQLRRAIAASRVPHAYLFCGPAGVGKYTTGLALAAALNCTERPGEGCGQCVACGKIAAGIHPDVQTLERQGAANIIPIATIRTQVIPQMGLPPHEGAVRVFLIEEAAALQEASANALLKTLEEPAPRTHFVLATTAAEQLLPTIRSRCQRVNFAQLPAALRAELASRVPVDEEQAAALAERAERAERVEALVTLLEQAVAGRDLGSVHDAAREVAQAKEILPEALECFAERLHGQAWQAAVDDELARAVVASQRAMRVLDTHSAVTQNAHGQLSVEAMLLDLRTTMP